MKRKLCAVQEADKKAANARKRQRKEKSKGSSKSADAKPKSAKVTFCHFHS